MAYEVREADHQPTVGQLAHRASSVRGKGFRVFLVLEDIRLNIEVTYTIDREGGGRKHEGHANRAVRRSGMSREQDQCERRRRKMDHACHMKSPFPGQWSGPSAAPAPMAAPAPCL